VRVGELDGDPLFDISNFDRCAAVHEVFAVAGEERREIQLDLALATRYEPAAAACSHGFDRGAEYDDRLPLITHLLAGCWAYSPTRVMAASRLVSLEPDQVPVIQRHPLVKCGDPTVEGGTAGLPCRRRWLDRAYGFCRGTTCEPAGAHPPPLVVEPARCAEAEWLTCYSTELDGFGTCYGGRCEVRCRTTGDCDVLDATEADVGGGGSDGGGGGSDGGGGSGGGGGGDAGGGGSALGADRHVCCKRRYSERQSTYLGVCLSGAEAHGSDLRCGEDGL
jgi:hypothetical protein